MHGCQHNRVIIAIYHSPSNDPSLSIYWLLLILIFVDNMGKSSKKKSKKHHKVERFRDDDLSLSDVLSYGLLRFPALQAELASLLTALDTNKAVQTVYIEDQDMKTYLEVLMSHLPVSHTAHEGWSKDMKMESVKSYVIEALLKSGSIVQPSAMTSSQSTATRFTVSKFFYLMEKYPDLLQEIEPILQMIRDGGVVDIDQIENEDIVELLSSFLSSMGLELIDDLDEHGYSLPSQSSSHHQAKDIINQYLDLLKSFQKAKKLLLSRPVANANQISSSSMHSAQAPNTNSHENEDSSSSSISSSDSSDDDESVRAISAKDSARSIGPAMPTMAQLALAQTSAKKYTPADDDDGYGPSLPSTKRLPSSSDILARQQMPLVYMEMPAYPPIGGADDDEEDVQVSNETKPIVREDWMLTPGERDPFSGIKDDKNRKFQTGKSAKKLAEALIKQREEYEKEVQEAGGVLADDETNKRGPSLMEQHHASKKSKHDHKSSSSAITALERLPFDRERDVLSHKKMTNMQVDKLVENARQLDSRFSKGFVQKSSL
jgi:hypothetical protein